MSDRAKFEDGETIDAIWRAVPSVDSAYRGPLRHRLEVAVVNRHPRLSIGWRWPAAGVLGTVAVVVVLLSPFTSGPSTPVSAKTLLERAAQVAGNPAPYRSTAEITVQDSTSDGVPLGLSRVADLHQSIIRSAVEDASHFRVRIHTVRPALEAGDMTIVADGSHTVAYSSIDRVAWSVPGAGAIGWPVGFGVAFSVNGTIAQLVANMNQRVHGTHARLLGERTIDGRATYLVKAWPATRISSGGCSNAQECLRKSHGYGYTLLWLDKDHMTTLRYELRGPRAQVQRLVYRVTSITYGAGPTQAELAFQPPVPVQHPGNGDEFSTGSGGTFGGISGKWIPSGGFLPADAPRNAQGHPLLQANSGTEDSAITRKPVGVDVLFAAHVSSIVTRRALRGGPTASGTYVYLEEHLRLNGIAPFFTAGIPHRSGGCSVWTGSYNNGFRWLGMQRGRVGIMLTSNSLSQGQLVTYARTQFCK